MCVVRACGARVWCARVVRACGACGEWCVCVVCVWCVSCVYGVRAYVRSRGSVKLFISFD